MPWPICGFDARNVEPTDDFEPIPAGKYLATIVASEMKPTKSGDGQFLSSLPGAGGRLQGPPLWARLNLTTPTSSP